MRISSGLFVIGIFAEFPDSSNTGGPIDFKCFNIGENQPYAMVHNQLEGIGCAQVYDNIKTANRACSLFEQCLLIGKNSDGNFELFTETDEDTNNLTLDKTQNQLFLKKIGDFALVLN